MADTKLMTGFDVSPENVTGKVGDTVKLTISSIQPADVTNGNIIPEVQDGSIATVTPEPNSLVLDVKLLKAGTTQINLKSGDGNYTKAVPVTVEDVQATQPAPTQPTAPVQPTKPADKPTQPSKMYVYYYSNPDGVNKEERCHTVYADVPFEVLPWRMHKEAPAKGMVDPVWDDTLNGGLGGWKENAGTAQGQILAQAQEAIDDLKTKSDEFEKKNAELDQANVKFDQAFKAMKENQQNSTEQSQMLTKALTKVMAGQENTDKLVMTMQATMETMMKKIEGLDKATPEKPADQGTDKQQNTNDQQNGGNK